MNFNVRFTSTTKVFSAENLSNKLKVLIGWNEMENIDY